MDRGANHRFWPTICVFILTVAGAVWNCDIVLGEAQVSYPADGAVIVGNNYPPNPPYTHIYTQLDFIPGPTAVKHTGYFSDTYDDVANRIEDANLGEPPYPSIPNRYYVGIPLIPPANDTLVRGTTYYWTVDERDADGNMHPGEVWKFTIQSYYAFEPIPPDEALDVETDVLLSWLPGFGACYYDVYIGTSWEDVNNAVYDSNNQPPEFLARISEPNIAVTGLELNTQYYWRVDGLSGRSCCGCDPSFPYFYCYLEAKGDVWCFTTEEHRIYVDIDAGGANNGTSWGNAYNFLQDALADANSLEKPVEICVAQGIYKPDQGGGQTTGDRTATFELINGVTLKGGYAGFGEPNPNARDIKLYETILSGDLDGNDIEVDPCDLLNEPTRAENSYHVVTCNGTDANAILDGFTITGGNADGAFPFYNGGGIYCKFSSPTLINCIISENSAKYFGGGMSNGSTWYEESSHPRITNCAFMGNRAKHGGGIFNEYSYPTLTNCVFIGNSADGNGGGMYNSSNPRLTNCTFSGNSAEYYGGIFNFPPPPGDGGVSSVGGSSYIVTNNFLWGNIVTNCIIWGNSDSRGMDESAQIGTFDIQIIINYSCVQGWNGGLGGIGNIDAAPCFADPCNGDYHLKSEAGRWDANSESWVVDDVTSPCIDGGNPGCPVGVEPAPNGNRRNMGAYGGTAEASKSPANWRSIADMTNDWVVDYNDLRIYVDYWLESGECIPSDFDRSQFVDFGDFAIFGLHWSYPSAEPGITYQIEKCDPNSFGSLATEPATETRFSVIVEGSYIHFKDMMVANCCPDELGLEMTVENNLITILETEFTPGGCYCICDYPVTATLGLFEAGTYTLEVYEDWGGFIGSTTVIVEPPQ